MLEDQGAFLGEEGSDVRTSGSSHRVMQDFAGAQQGGACRNEGERVTRS